ncbi:MAG: hypothetical protein AB4080_25450 [Trichodesmium sp.]
MSKFYVKKDVYKAEPKKGEVIINYPLSIIHYQLSIINYPLMNYLILFDV